MGIDEPYKERMDDNSNKEENNNVCYATLNTDLSYNEALNGPDQSKWKIAIQEELDGLQEKEVFSDEICPPETKPLETRFAFMEKQNADTSKRYKARLVVKGYRQKCGIDYVETFSPVMHFDIFRAIIAMAAIAGWDAQTLDFTRAYLNAPLKENLWVILPDKSTKKLEKALYGLEQAGLQWAKTLSDHVLSRRNWVRSDYDECVFYSKNVVDSRIAILWVYVDDCGLTGNWKEEIDDITNHLLDTFPSKNLGKPKTYVGMQLSFGVNGIFINQQRYAIETVQTFLGNTAKAAKIPLEKGADLTPRTTNEEMLGMERYPYRQALGQMLYLANMSRPDIANAVRELGKVSSDPTLSVEYWQTF